MKFDYFPSGSGFWRNVAPEHWSPSKTKVATLHRYKIVVRGLDGQDYTAACGRLQPGSVTPSIDSHVSGLYRSKLPLSGEHRYLSGLPSSYALP